MFQSAPGFLAGRYSLIFHGDEGAGKFQSAPGFLAGRYCLRRDRTAIEQVVSIRSRLFSREILGVCQADLLLEAFQSAPGFLAGRYPAPGFLKGSIKMFQSAPGFLAGRYFSAAKSLAACSRGFQSAPGFLAGRYRQPTVADMRRAKFQSAPGFLAGRYLLHWLCNVDGAWVSIRSRLFSREILHYLSHAGVLGQFQSAPGFLAGRYRCPRDQGGLGSGFNPLPAF